MTKKITRLFCIVLALTLVCTFVAGCSMFQTNADRYREKTAFKVGEQTVTVGALEDFINTNMASYLNQGYDAQSVWDALMPQFIMNYVLVDMLKEDLPWPKVTQTHSAASDYPDSEFLKNENDMEFIMKTVKNSLYQSLDSLVETELNNKYELNAAEEEEERKENVIPEDELNLPLGGLTLNDYDDDIEGLDEDLAKYRADDELTVDSILNGYKFEDENDPLLLDALAKVNDRIARNEDASDDEKVAFTAKEYMTAQKAAFNSLRIPSLQNLAQELLRAGELGVIEDVGGRAVLSDFSAVHKEHAVSHFAGEAHFVGYDDHCHAVVREVFDEVQYLAYHFGVERRGRLVEEHDLRLHGKRADDGNPLFLSARERCGVDQR